MGFECHIRELEVLAATLEAISAARIVANLVSSIATDLVAKVATDLVVRSTVQASLFSQKSEGSPSGPAHAVECLSLRGFGASFGYHRD